MVNSYTALRTRIAQRYNKVAHKVPGKGLFVAMSRTEVSEEDKICYKCSEYSYSLKGQVMEGVLFSLEQQGISCTSRIRPLPTTSQNFLLRCVKSGITIVSQAQRTNTTPQEIAQDAGYDVIINSPNLGYANYTIVDIDLSTIPPSSWAGLLSHSTYIRSEKHEGRFRVLFRLGKAREVKAEAGDIAELLELLAKHVIVDTDTAERWKGYGLKEIVEIVNMGMVETLFTANAESEDWNEDGVW